MVKRRVGGGLKKPPLTHFLCLPLVTSSSRPQLEASVKAFAEKVSPSTPVADQRAGDTRDADVTLSYVHPKAIRPVGALHCTLGVMSLDKDKLEEVLKLLRSIDMQALLNDAGKGDNPASRTTTTSVPKGPSHKGEEPLKVDLKGLVSMHAPSKTSILYTAPTDATGRLFPFCNALQKIFKDKGFVTDDRPLKLHATIVNTIYAKGKGRPPRSNANQQGPAKATNEGSSGRIGSSTQGDRSYGHGPNANAPLKIDATALLEQFKDFSWAENVVLDRVALCEMGAKKILDGGGNVKDEEYTEVLSIPMI